ncbi:hypothetical protein PBRA_006241 [Plasmodiophora brassicae]|nr:hypothetical protein PBRA_006241 [Plasmodiophora brassicae]
MRIAATIIVVNACVAVLAAGTWDAAMGMGLIKRSGSVDAATVSLQHREQSRRRVSSRRHHQDIPRPRRWLLHPSTALIGVGVVVLMRTLARRRRLKPVVPRPKSTMKALLVGIPAVATSALLCMFTRHKPNQASPEASPPVVVRVQERPRCCIPAFLVILIIMAVITAGVIVAVIVSRRHQSRDLRSSSVVDDDLPT